MDASNKSIGGRLRVIREARGMTQTELGAAIGETRHIIENVEYGRTVLSLARAARIAAVLHCPTDELLAAPDAPVPPRPRMRGSFRRSLPDETGEHRGDRH
jgi:transcriptional regulator with XRE-family HTH domain